MLQYIPGYPLRNAAVHPKEYTPENRYSISQRVYPPRIAAVYPRVYPRETLQYIPEYTPENHCSISQRVYPRESLQYIPKSIFPRNAAVYPRVYPQESLQYIPKKSCSIFQRAASKSLLTRQGGARLENLRSCRNININLLYLALLYHSGKKNKTPTTLLDL